MMLFEIHQHATDVLNTLPVDQLARDVLPAATSNPFEGLSPNWDIFGSAFDAWWKKLFAGIWAIAIVIAGVNLITGFVAMGKNEEDNDHLHAQGKKKAKWAGISLICLVGLGAILGAAIVLAP